MAKRQWVRVTKEREVHTYSELWHTSWCLLEKGQNEELGSTHQFRASIVFTAFALEAYLNHLGPKLFNGPSWSAVERLSPKGKLDLIAEKIDLPVDYGKRPWGIVKDLFGFRDSIAHGKSVVMPESKTLPLDKYDDYFREFVQTSWEKFCDRRNAERTREDVEAIVRALHEKAGVQDEHPFIGGSQLGSATVFEE